jgi:F0F1-type ATP synthase delta subunit
MNTMDESVSKNEPVNVAKALMQWLSRKSQKENWEYKLWIIGSMVDSKIAIKSKEITKKGRPKTIFISNGKDSKGIVTPHLHMLIKCNPGETMMQELKKYWNNKFNKDNIYRMTYKREVVYCTIGAKDYM